MQKVDQENSLGTSSNQQSHQTSHQNLRDSLESSLGLRCMNALSIYYERMSYWKDGCKQWSPYDVRDGCGVKVLMS